MGKVGLCATCRFCVCPLGPAHVTRGLVDAACWEWNPPTHTVPRLLGLPFRMHLTFPVCPFMTDPAHLTPWF